MTPDDIGTSIRLPSTGRAVTYTVRLHAPADQPLVGDYAVTLQVEGRRVAVRTVQARLAAGQRQDVPLEWTPRRDGWQRLSFAITPVGTKTPSARVEQTVPVTSRPLYFVWFGAPQHFKWCNVPTTVKEEDRDWWLWHGAIPCAWKGGVCYKDWSVEKFAEYYRGSPWIAIDEVGTLDEAGRKIMAAVRAHKQVHPDGCRAIWFIGVHDYWRDYRDCVDLYVPEIYLNYRGNHLGQIDAYVRRAREVGAADRMIPGLGINIITDKQKRPTVIPTREDVLRQIRHLKTIAPGLPGVGFFKAQAAPGVAEYADELCREYYINPVATLAPDTLRARLKGNSLELRAVLRNCGGMTAHRIEVQFGSGYGEHFRGVTKQRVTALAPGREVTVSQQVPLQSGIRSYGIRLPRQAQVTLLDDALWTMAGHGLPGSDPVVWQPITDMAGGGLPLFAPAPSGLTATTAAFLAPDGASTSQRPASILPGLPDDPGPVATWVPNRSLPHEPLAFQFTDTEENQASGLTVERGDGTVTISDSDYRVVLDLTTDQVTSLRHGDENTELLGSPWGFSSTAYTGFQPAQLRDTPGGLQVTIPFTNPQAEGFSRYFCYAGAPVIRIERWFRPHGELTVTSSSEGCGMPQRGGVFALQAGVGGPVVRGQLHDSRDYRDLLFGYLGCGPRPDNARRAGWFDCSFTRDGGGGLGVVIERRWEAAHSDVGYDVTRYYDGGDSLAVMNLWGKKLTVAQPQGQIVYLLPHGPLDLDQAQVVPPAQRLWNNLHQRARPGLTTSR